MSGSSVTITDVVPSADPATGTCEEIEPTRVTFTMDIRSFRTAKPDEYTRIRDLIVTPWRTEEGRRDFIDNYIKAEDLFGNFDGLQCVSQIIYPQTFEAGLLPEDVLPDGEATPSPGIVMPGPPSPASMVPTMSSSGGGMVGTPTIPGVIMPGPPSPASLMVPTMSSSGRGGMVGTPTVPGSDMSLPGEGDISAVSGTLPAGTLPPTVSSAPSPAPSVYTDDIFDEFRRFDPVHYKRKCDEQLYEVMPERREEFELSFEYGVESARGDYHDYVEELEGLILDYLAASVLRCSSGGGSQRLRTSSAVC